MWLLLLLDSSIPFQQDGNTAISEMLVVQSPGLEAEALPGPHDQPMYFELHPLTAVFRPNGTGLSANDWL